MMLSFVGQSIVTVSDSIIAFMDQLDSSVLLVNCIMLLHVGALHRVFITSMLTLIELMA